MPILDLADEVDVLADKFSRIEIPQRLFLNSVPKCGTHLVRNIARMFISNDQTYRPFVVDHDFAEHADGFGNADKKFFCGHLNFHPYTALGINGMRHLVLVRDPYDYVLSMARFLYSEHYSSPLGDFVKAAGLDFDIALAFVINGVFEPDMYLPSVDQIYRENALKWRGLSTVVRYEDVIAAVSTLEHPDSTNYMLTLLGQFGIATPPVDWMDRIRTGADSAVSATVSASASVSARLETYRHLPERFQHHLESIAPGLRATLGYGSYPNPALRRAEPRPATAISSIKTEVPPASRRRTKK